jgi:hypothetical protein
MEDMSVNIMDVRKEELRNSHALLRNIRIAESRKIKLADHVIAIGRREIEAIFW